jgi:xylulokinase
MPSPALFLGIDVSTTSVKALLVDDQGGVVSVGSSELSLSTPYPLWSEQNPLDWWQATLRSIQTAFSQAGVGGEAVKAVGLTGQMHGLVLLDSADQVLRPAILWNDQRNAEQCDQVSRLIGEDRLLQLSGNRALTGFTAPKILWVRQYEPEVFQNINHILLPKDYVRLRLTGEYACDKADGSGTILFNLKERDWSKELLQALDIPRAWLPDSHEGPEVTGGITAEVGELTGIVPGTPVVAGGGDQAAQAIGVGAITPGIVALTLGTSGVVFAPTAQPFIEPHGRLHAFCHALPETWHLMGVMLSAAGSLRWFHDTFVPHLSYEDLVNSAAEVPPGAEGLLFLPYLTGERTPHPDPLARAAFVGLTVRHNRSHMSRAVLEGVAFGLRDSMDLILGAGLEQISQVRISGGGSRSRLWRQIIADVLGSELVTVNTTEGAAYGAALLAGVGIGAWRSVEEACQACIKVMEKVQPGEQEVGIYNEIYPKYRELYPALKPTFHAVAEGE